MIPLTVVDACAEPPHSEVPVTGPPGGMTEIERFEHAFALLTKTRFAMATRTPALARDIALGGLGLAEHDEVVTSPFCSTATLDAIVRTGARVRFADVCDDDFGIDPDAVAAIIGPRTRAILAVHLYGQPADLGKLTALAAEYDLRVVEDAAQALGATCEGRQAGSHELGCFSLPGRTPSDSCGVVTFAEDARVGPDQHRTPQRGITEQRAALGFARLARLPSALASRAHNARTLGEGLAGTPGLRVPFELPGRDHVWHQYTVRVGPHAMLSRDELATALAGRGIGTRVYYPRLVFDADDYRGHPALGNPSEAEFPFAARLTEEVLSLPVHEALTASQLDLIVNAVREELGA
ncbi:DegT/DnrJ/EryC1/StrS family aminotransferase [Saccharomonospora sp. NPDC006951]